jgi:toxin ParE1/3/4
VKRELRFTKEALEDFRGAIEWYSEIDSALAARLEIATSELLERISDEPNQFPIVDTDTRRAIMRRFPYGVFFIVDDTRIVITAILHHRREPRKPQV